MRVWHVLLLIMALMMGFAVIVVPENHIAAQTNPTDQQLTVEAAVQQLFTATAEANREIPMTQTIAAAFDLALTATATSQFATPLPAADWIEFYSNIPQSRLDDGAFVLGNPDASVTIVLFADFACPHCQEYYSDINQFIEEYVVTGDARLEYRMFISAADPVYGPSSAQLAECADTLQPGMFWPAYDVLYELGNQSRFSEKTPGSLAEKLGLNAQDLRHCAESASQFRVDSEFGADLGVQAVPTIMVRLNGREPQFVKLDGRLWDSGPLPYEALQVVVEDHE